MFFQFYRKKSGKYKNPLKLHIDPLNNPNCGAIFVNIIMGTKLSCRGVIWIYHHIVVTKVLAGCGFNCGLKF